VYSLVQGATIEAIVVMRQSVMHLSRALRVTNVRNFVFTGRFLNCFDVSFVVVKTHVAPMEVPVLVVFGSIESLVAPTVLGTTVVADPDVKASVDKFKGKMLLVSEGGDPLSTILVVSVLDKDTTLCGNRS